MALLKVFGNLIFLFLKLYKICQYDIFLSLKFFLPYTINRQIGVIMNKIIPIHHEIYTVTKNGA